MKLWSQINKECEAKVKRRQSDPLAGAKAGILRSWQAGRNRNSNSSWNDCPFLFFLAGSVCSRTFLVFAFWFVVEMAVWAGSYPRLTPLKCMIGWVPGWVPLPIARKSGGGELSSPRSPKSALILSINMSFTSLMVNLTNLNMITPLLEWGSIPLRKYHSTPNTLLLLLL